MRCRAKNTLMARCTGLAQSVFIERRINPVSPPKSFTILYTCGNPTPDIVNTRVITTNALDTLANMAGVRNLELVKTGKLKPGTIVNDTGLAKQFFTSRDPSARWLAKARH